jgi:hypothetical protein
LSETKFSIALKVNDREVYGTEAKEAIIAYWHSIQKTAYRKMERLHSRALQWAEDYDKRKKRLVSEPVVCDKTIICNNAEGCEKRSCPARTVKPDTWHRRWNAL